MCELEGITVVLTAVGVTDTSRVNRTSSLTFKMRHGVLYLNEV